MRLSLVIPAYNEAERIGRTLTDSLVYLARQAYASEIVVVDDGSTDDTSAVVTALLNPTSVPIRLHRFPENRGKGAAVRQGMLYEAQGEYRFFSDADGSTPIEELASCWPIFEAGADIVIGSRALPSPQIERRQRW